MEFTSGNKTVDSLAQIQFTGNVIPHMWYRTVLRENNKPHLLAITILADIVYWYRPVELRDEQTGKFIGYAKKFKDDELLQRSYDQFSELFGESKRSVTDAIIRLEQLGVIKRVFRTIEVGGMRCNNVLYIQLIPDILQQLTYPEAGVQQDNREEYISEDTLSHNDVTPIPKFRDRSPEIKREVSLNNVTAIPKFRETNTENTTENTTEIKSSSGDDELKAQIKYQETVQKYPAELVRSVFQELRNREDEMIQIITPDMFATVCDNIIHYAGSISNQPAYICKCLDNIFEAKKIAEACSEKRSELSTNQFNHFHQNKYDFTVLERELLSVNFNKKIKQ